MKTKSLSLKALSYIRNFLNGTIKLITEPYTTVYYIKFPNKKGVKLCKVTEQILNKNDTFTLVPVTFGNKYSIIVSGSAISDLTESNVMSRLTQIAQSK